jgi:hypothetical protein
MMRSPSPFQGGPKTPAEHDLFDALNDSRLAPWVHSAIESGLLAHPSDAADAFNQLAGLFQARADELYGHLPYLDANQGRLH